MVNVKSVPGKKEFQILANGEPIGSVSWEDTPNGIAQLKLFGLYEEIIPFENQEIWDIENKVIRVLLDLGQVPYATSSAAGKFEFRSQGGTVIAKYDFFSKQLNSSFSVPGSLTLSYESFLENQRFEVFTSNAISTAFSILFSDLLNWVSTGKSEIKASFDTPKE
jgi:hypothetical protein